MLDNATQLTRQLVVGIDSVSFDSLLLRKFSGREQVSQLFVYELEMQSADEAISAQSVVGKNATWLLNHSGEDER